MSKKLFVIFLLIFLSPLSNFSNTYGQSNFDSTDIGLDMPTITITPTSGPPGTQIKIDVTNMPAIPKNIDPRIEFFVYLPFLSAFGSNVPHNCAGENCIVLYSFEEISKSKLEPKTITFTLFGKTNPKPIVLEGKMESVCDLKINGNTVQRYSNTCNDKNQPSGEYEIKFGWGIQSSEVYDIQKILIFTVYGDTPSQEQKLQNPDDIIINQFNEGLISEDEFEKELLSLGYDSEKIRQVKGLLGKLEHQISISEDTQQKEIIKEKIKIDEEEQEIIKEEIQTDDDQKEPISNSSEGGGCLIATAAFASELAPQIQQLRELRDEHLLQTEFGSTFMNSFNIFYYSFSPVIADYERENPVFKETVKIILTPLITSLSILNYVDINSDQEVLGYGISMILLNIGMYFLVPSVVIYGIRKFCLQYKKFEYQKSSILFKN